MNDKSKEGSKQQKNSRLPSLSHLERMSSHKSSDPHDNSSQKPFPPTNFDIQHAKADLDSFLETNSHLAKELEKDNNPFIKIDAALNTITNKLDPYFQVSDTVPEEEEEEEEDQQ